MYHRFRVDFLGDPRVSGNGNMFIFSHTVPCLLVLTNCIDLSLKSLAKLAEDSGVRAGADGSRF